MWTGVRPQASFQLSVLHSLYTSLPNGGATTVLTHSPEEGMQSREKRHSLWVDSNRDKMTGTYESTRIFPQLTIDVRHKCLQTLCECDLCRKLYSLKDWNKTICTYRLREWKADFENVLQQMQHFLSPKFTVIIDISWFHFYRSPPDPLECYLSKRFSIFGQLILTSKI